MCALKTAFLHEKCLLHSIGVEFRGDGPRRGRERSADPTTEFGELARAHLRLVPGDRIDVLNVRLYGPREFTAEARIVLARAHRAVSTLRG